MQLQQSNRPLAGLLTTAVCGLLLAGCNATMSGGAGTPVPGGGGGMPTPIPPPVPAPSPAPSPGGGSTGGSTPSGGGSGLPGGGSGIPGGGGGMPGGGGGMPGGGSSGGSSGGGDSGGSGVPQVGLPEPGIPPMPSETPDGPTGKGSGDGEVDPDADPDWEGDGDCNTGGAIPGGIGGMGTGGDCMEGGGDGDGDGTAGSIGQVPGDGGSGGPSAEELGEELDKSLGDFDGVIMEEQREIQTVGRNTEGFGTGGAGGSAGIILGEQAGTGSGNGVTVVNEPLERESPIAGMTQEQMAERTPDDVPVAADDDIIARQLREAALAEEDPVLRERLWDEYRKYKGL